MGADSLCTFVPQSGEEDPDGESVKEILMPLGEVDPLQMDGV